MAAVGLEFWRFWLPRARWIWGWGLGRHRVTDMEDCSVLSARFEAIVWVYVSRQRGEANGYAEVWGDSSSPEHFRHARTLPRRLGSAHWPKLFF